MKRAGPVKSLGERVRRDATGALGLSISESPFPVGGLAGKKTSMGDALIFIFTTVTVNKFFGAITILGHQFGNRSLI